MINPIAVYVGSIVINWSTLIIVLGVCAWFCLSQALYTARGGESKAMWIYLPIALVLSLLFARLLHWYCHAEQYGSLTAAFTDLSVGGWSMPGVLLGAALPALLIRMLRRIPDAPALLDALAPGAALGIAMIRLSALFNSSCRGTVVITDPRFQRLPLGSPVTTLSGGVEYHFATFFIQFLLMLLLTALLLAFYFRGSGRPMVKGPARGHTALLFLLLYSAMELVMDSTRYDSSFFRSNGFVSVVQIVGALSILGVMIFYSVCSLRANGLKGFHWIIWVGYLATVGGVGYLEYLVQRHGNWYLACYGGMSAFCVAMAMAVYVMYRTGCVKKEKPSGEGEPPAEDEPSGQTTPVEQAAQAEQAE